MKKIWWFAIVVFLVSSWVANAQKPNWSWATSAKDINFSWVNHQTVDDSGNIYIVGTFGDEDNTGNVITDTLKFGADTLAGFRRGDIFFGKLNPQGNVLWLKVAGGRGLDEGNAIAVDKNGNVYVASSFEDTAIYDDTIHVVSNGFSDICLVKYSSQGILLWLKTWGTIYADKINDIVFNSQNILYLTGFFAGDYGSPPTYEDIMLDSIQLTSKGGADGFVMAVDSTGQVLIGKNFGSKFADISNKITLSKDDEIYIGGYSAGYNFYSDSEFYYQPDFFFLKMNASLITQWLKGVTFNSVVNAEFSLTLDRNSNLVVGGYNYNDIPNILDNIILNDDNAFVAKYTTDGNLLWAKNLGYHSNDAITSVITDKENNIYVGGTFRTVGIFGTDTLIGKGNDDYLIVKLDSNGKQLWTQTAGGPSNDWIYDLALDKNNDLIVAGMTSSSPSYFGNSIVVNATGAWDACVSKLSTTTGIRDVAFGAGGVELYPNPGDGEVRVRSAVKFFSLTITNFLGQQLLEMAFPNGVSEQSINLSKVASGVYNFSVQTSKGSISRNIVIQH